MTDLDNARRLGELEQVVEMVAALLEQERERPGSVDDVAVQGLHGAVLFWSAVRST